MNVHNENSDRALLPGLAGLLASYRRERAFNAADTVARKAGRLNAYMAAHGLKSCVVAVSGGIDSAAVLGLVAAARRQEGSPVQQVVPVLLPVFDEVGATGQDSATARGREVCGAFGFAPAVMDLTAPYKALRSVVEGALSGAGNDWARGQLVAYQRTPALYYTTSVLTGAGQPAIIVGTTNLDEGAYLGYFGKASDGLVDVQLISDLHKSEVYAIARHLQVPASVLDVVPTGDMYDGRVDEDVFGTSYDFVELFLAFKRQPRKFQASLKKLDAAAQDQFAVLSGRLEKLHAYNAHKYIAKSPAVHLDLTDAKVKGGWDYGVWTPAR